MRIETVDYRRGAVRILDQSALPAAERYLEISEPSELAGAIRSMKIRGAPAIGIAAAYGVLLGIERALAAAIAAPPAYIFDREAEWKIPPAAGIDPALLAGAAQEAAELLAESRPTAVNLFWALERMRAAVAAEPDDAKALCTGAAREAFAIHEEQLSIEQAIGRHGADLFPDGAVFLTHCNAGGLATAGFGTALGIVYELRARGRRVAVYADETRPLLQGARLTAWELSRAGIEVTLLCDGADQAGRGARRGRPNSGERRCREQDRHARRCARVRSLRSAALHRCSVVVVRPCDVNGGRYTDRGARPGRGAFHTGHTDRAGRCRGLQPRFRYNARRTGRGDRDRNGCYRAPRRG